MPRVIYAECYKKAITLRVIKLSVVMTNVVAPIDVLELLCLGSLNGVALNNLLPWPRSQGKYNN
jgi:hypothetical protein